MKKISILHWSSKKNLLFCRFFEPFLLLCLRFGDWTIFDFILSTSFTIRLKIIWNEWNPTVWRFLMWGLAEEYNKMKQGIPKQNNEEDYDSLPWRFRGFKLCLVLQQKIYFVKMSAGEKNEVCWKRERPENKKCKKKTLSRSCIWKIHREPALMV